MNDPALKARTSAFTANPSLLVSSFALALFAAGCKTTPAPAPLDDASLAQAVQAKIAADSSLTSEPIQSSVQQGVATLSGSVSTDSARTLAASDTAQVAGIRTVINNLTVTTAQALTPVAPAQPAPLPPVRHGAPKLKPVKSARAVPPPPAPQQAEIIPPPAPIERKALPTPVPPSQPSAPPEVHTIVIPADTSIPIRMGQTLDSASTQEGDTFSGTLASDVLVDGRVVLRQGSAVTGRVDTVHEAAHFKGSSLLTIQLTSIQARANSLQVSTDTFSKEGTGRGKNTAEKIGGGAAVGAILGGIFGGGKGAGIGAAAGGGIGAGAQAATRGQQVQIPAETLVRFRLTSPVTVTLSGQQHSSAQPDLQHHE